MKKWEYRILVIVFVLTLLVSGGFLVYKYIEGVRAAQAYNSAAEIAGIQGMKDLPTVAPSQSAPPSPSESGGESDETVDPALLAWIDSMSKTDLSALRKINPEVNTWIAIPDSELNYPVMAHTDNTFYLNHTWLGVSNAAGAIFLDGRCSPDLSDFNTIIYGHRMHNNMMFGTLRFYDGLDYWKDHPRVYLFTDSGVRVYDIFAAMETPVDSPTYSFGLTDVSEKQAFIDYALETSVLDTGIVPTPEDSILTLSTCTQQGGPQSRWVVQAVLRD